MRCNGQFVVLKTSVCVSMTTFSCPFLNMNLKSAHNVVVRVLKKKLKNIFIPNQKSYSSLLIPYREYMVFMNPLRGKLER